jgi:polar amino acid transport system substrate-binding protein
VLANTAHEAYLQQTFPASPRKTFASLPEAQEALLAAQIDTLFADGPTLAIWLADIQGECCTFRGGAFYNSAFFGEGARIALRGDDAPLRTAINASLKRLDAKGILADLMGKYFPISFY